MPSAEATAAAPSSGTWLAELTKLAYVVRAAALLLTTVWLGGVQGGGLLFLAVALAAAATFVPLLAWDRIAPVFTRRPLYLAFDLALSTFILAVAGPESPFFLFTLASAALAGLLYGFAGAALFGVLLVAAYLWSLSLRDQLDAGLSFQTAIGLPAMYLFAAVGCAAARRLLTAQARTEAAAAIERERVRLARDMHDSLAKTVHGLALAASAVARRVERDPEGAAQAARQLAADAETAGREARGLIHGLRDGSAGRPLPEVVAERARAAASEGGLALELQVDPAVEAAPQGRHELLRILDEALANVRAHAGAASVVVRLQARDDDLVLEVADDGCGFDAGGAPGAGDGRGHFGIVGMRERARHVGGDLEVRTGPGEGCAVVCHLPRAAMGASPVLGAAAP